jgi:hypothetical protein
MHSQTRSFSASSPSVRWASESYKNNGHSCVISRILLLRSHNYYPRYSTVLSPTHIVKGRSKVVPVLNELSTTPWRRVGEWTYSAIILDLGIRWRWVVSFTHRLLYLRGNSSRYPLDRRLGGAQSRSRHCEVKKNLLLCRDSNPGRPA